MKKSVIILTLVVILTAGIVTTGALYKSEKKGQASISVASPRIRLIDEKTNVAELDLQTYSNDFKVVNYDESGKVTEVGLDYILSFDITDEDAPIDMKLYKIGNNGSETEIPLNRNLQAARESFNAGQKTEKKYRLKMWFNLEKGQMDKNVNINVNLNSTQKEPVS